ncbi:MAG: flagellar protein FliT [Schwartzia sp.]|nr:flagellar protein FliT [Schwartzia sp. (in: firmicutes)]
MAEDVKVLWEKYYILTTEMQKFLDRNDIDAFLELAGQRNVIFDRMQETDTPELRESPEYKAFLEKTKPAAMDVLRRAQSWLARSKRQNTMVRGYGAKAFNPNGRMFNQKM